MGPRQSNAKNVYILLVEATEALSILIERCFHESSRVTDIVTHLIASPESHFDSDTLLDELKRRPYDCLLMDQQLPEALDAVALAQQARESLTNPPAVVLITDTADEEFRQRALAAGVSDLLDRHELTPASLRRVIDIAVQQYQPAQGQ